MTSSSMAGDAIVVSCRRSQERSLCVRHQWTLPTSPVAKAKGPDPEANDNRDEKADIIRHRDEHKHIVEGGRYGDEEGTAGIIAQDCIGSALAAVGARYVHLADRAHAPQPCTRDASRHHGDDRDEVGARRVGHHA